MIQNQDLTGRQLKDFKRITGHSLSDVEGRTEPLLKPDGSVVHNEDGSVLVTSVNPQPEELFAMAYIVLMKEDKSLTVEGFEDWYDNASVKDLEKILGAEEEEKKEEPAA